jgi:hypothetical protein
VEFQTEEAGSVGAGDFTELHRRDSPCLRKTGQRQGRESGLVSLATIRNGSQVRCVSLHQNPFGRYEREQAVVRPGLEGDHSGEREVPASLDGCFGQVRRSGVAMEHAEYAFAASLADHGRGIVGSFARVNDDRPGGFSCKGELSGKSFPLLVPRRVVVVIIESALSNGACAGGYMLSDGIQIASRVERLCVVRMYARREPDETGVAGGNGGCALRGRQRLSDRNDCLRARLPGAEDYIVSISVESRVRKMGVTVDETRH